MYDGGRPQFSVKCLWAAADHKKKPVYTFLPASFVCNLQVAERKP
jgi:hypothetical protein